LGKNDWEIFTSSPLYLHAAVSKILGMMKWKSCGI
jgi:cellobiose phosphorylase